MSLKLLPEDMDMISHQVKPDPMSDHNFIVTFDYPDCTRTYDGRAWSVQPKPVANNLFTTPQA